MKRIVLLLLPLMLLSCSEESTGPETPTPVRPISSGELALARANTSFGITLFRSVAASTPDANIFLSPLSVSMALGMTVNGAAGETWLGMRQALHFADMTQSEINQSYRSLLDLLRGIDPRVRLDIANSIWSREGFPLEQAFVDSNRYYFDAEIRTLDFSRADAADIINAWVSQMTQGKIPDIVSTPIPDLVMMYLINAVYFKGSWAEQFDAQKTRDDIFMTIDGGRKNIKMMNRSGSMRYHQGELVEIADLPYGWDRYSMAVILPRPGVTLGQVRDALLSEQWAAWQSKLQDTEMDLQLPRFTLEYEVGLNEMLKSMGMERAFDPDLADFSGINRDRKLYITNVKHKTYVMVNEEGTEAAAATSVEMGTTSMPPVMRVDHPFVFVIHERNSGAILFIGQVTNPGE
ncbi:MAG: serpin family protein [Bacteroidetes bacterium]|nr:serpin family protein [Bacteroidota bacterium]